MLLRWGICGCGSISTDFAQCITLLPRNEHKVAAVAASSIERAQSFVTAVKLDDVKTFGSYEELYNCPDIDVIYFGLLNHMHKDEVMKALNHGKHVLCEKPLGLNAIEVREIVECAKKNNRFLMEGYWTRFFPAWKEVKSKIKSGVIGDVKVISADFGYVFLKKNKMVPELGGGCLTSIGCYMPMLACYVYDEKPTKITAVGFKTDTGVDDSASIFMEFSGDKMAHLFYSCSAVAPCQSSICGTKGRIQISHHVWCPTEITVTQCETNTQEKTEKYRFSLPQADGMTFVHPNGNGMVYEAECVRECIMKGLTECPLMSLKHSVELAEILDEIRKQLGVKFPQDK